MEALEITAALAVAVDRLSLDPEDRVQVVKEMQAVMVRLATVALAVVVLVQLEPTLQVMMVAAEQ
jgi:hypothetical protein